MPRDSNAVYSLPSGYLAVPGETIQASQHNPPLEDLAQAMTDSLPRSGAAPMAGALKTITGSKSSPAIYPNSNPTVGLYWTSTGVAFAGTVGGVRYIGELIPYTFLTPEPLTVLPYGQTLLRASYPDLWAKAQTDIAAGNNFYNNGNGSTTFGIGDLRGRVIAGKDNMGGSNAGRLPASGAVNGTILGYAAGSHVHQLTIAQLAQHAHTATTTNGSSAFTLTFSPSYYSVIDQTNVLSVQTGAVGNVLRPTGTNTPTVTIPSGALSLSTSVNNNGSSDPHNNVQPTMVCNYLLYVGA